MQPIYITSPKNKIKVIVGSFDFINREAIFYISQLRHFHEADAIGIDKDILERKSLAWCEKIIFKLWNGKIYVITKEDFIKYAWLYPPRNDPDFKAPGAIFKPKLVLTMDKVRKLHKKNRAEENEELLRVAVS